MPYAQQIVAATTEIFSSMLMLEVSPGEPFARSQGPLNNSISGIIGLAGKSKGLLAIHLPKPLATAITTAFLGMDVQEIDEDVCDAVGELANMLGGNLKSALDPKGSEIQLSMPTAIHGEEYAIDCLANAIKVAVPFELEGTTFLVELQLRSET